MKRKFDMNKQLLKDIREKKGMFSDVMTDAQDYSIKMGNDQSKSYPGGERMSDIHQRYKETTEKMAAFLAKPKFSRPVGEYYLKMGIIQEELMEIHAEAIGELLEQLDDENTDQHYDS